MRRVVRVMPGWQRPPLPDSGNDRHDQLLSTKLFVPRTPPGFVPRSRLIERLNAGLSGGLTLVCAPAGYGKTALVSSWAQQRPLAWLSLDPGDNDPARFWRHVLVAIDGVRPGTAQRVEPALAPPASPSIAGPVSLLINDLAGEPDPVEIVLALDDYHVIDSKAIHESLTFVLEHRPPQLHLVVLSRVDPPLPMARLRAAGQLAELRADDLRFSVDETAALVRLALQVALADDSVAALAARTEGWAVGLRLATLSLQGHPDAAGFVQAFSGSHHFVLDYLSEEVLERQPEPIRRFLLETSVLDRLSGELCDAVTGRTDSRRMLEAIDRANLFVVPLDDVREWWRYHQLFADLLRAHLQHEWPDRVTHLHRNAARWYERHWLADDAIRHALAAGDAGWAARLIEREVDALLLRSERGTLDRWVAALPVELVGSRPRLLLAQTVVAMVEGRVDEAESLLAAAERALAARGDEPAEACEPSVGRAGSTVANEAAAIALVGAAVARWQGDAERIGAYCQQALGYLTEDDRAMRLLVDWDLAVADGQRGRLAQAEHALVGVVAERRAAGEGYLAVRAACDLGQVQRARGHLAAALATYAEALEIARDGGRLLPPAGLAHVGMAHLGMAEVWYERGELAVALEHVTEGIPLCRNIAYPRPVAAGLATLARIRWAAGDLTGALQVIADDPQVVPSVRVTNLLNPIPLLRARLLLASGDLAAAIRWTNDRGLGADDDVSYPREPEYLLLARVLLVQSDVDRAVALLDRLRSLAELDGRVRSVLEIDALRAVAMAAAGDATSALATLSAALALAQPEGYIQLFAEEGVEMQRLLVRLIAAQRDDEDWAQRVPLGYLGQLMRAFEAGDGPARTPAERRGIGAPGLIEPLSEREIEVLRLLAVGKSNHDVAEELCVALDTVKKHVSHILAKLGANNRTEATARARALGLLVDRTEPPTSSRS
jgi:LuxR family maltose regulon positive regulatory protein